MQDIDIIKWRSHQIHPNLYLNISRNQMQIWYLLYKSCPLGIEAKTLVTFVRRIVNIIFFWTKNELPLESRDQKAYFKKIFRTSTPWARFFTAKSVKEEFWTRRVIQLIFSLILCRSHIGCYLPCPGWYGIGPIQHLSLKSWYRYISTIHCNSIRSIILTLVAIRTLFFIIHHIIDKIVQIHI